MAAALERLNAYTYMEGCDGLAGMLSHHDVDIVAAKEAEDENGLRAKVMLAFWFEYPGDRVKITTCIKETLSPAYPDIFCEMDGDMLVIETKKIK